MVYAYLRVSTDKQDGQNQRLGIEALATARGLTIDEYIDDEGKSGTLEPEKRELGKLLKKLKSGDILLAGEISRLGRSLFMVFRILEHCLNNGITVMTAKDGYTLGNDIQSKVMAFAFGLSAEIERDMISRRTKEALAMMKCCENCYYRNYIEEDDEYGCGLYWSGNPNTDECIYDRSCEDRTNAVDRWKLKE